MNFPGYFIAQEIQDFFQCLLFLIAMFNLIICITLTLLQNFNILGAQGPLMLMGSKLLKKMTRPQYIVLHLNVLRPGHLYQKY